MCTRVVCGYFCTKLNLEITKFGEMFIVKWSFRSSPLKKKKTSPLNGNDLIGLVLQIIKFK